MERLAHKAAVPAGSALVAAVLLVKAGAARRLVVWLAVLAVRALTPLAFLVAWRSTGAVLRPGATTWRQLLGNGVSLWCMAEIGFLMYMLQCRRYFDRQTTIRWRAVSTHSTPEKRLASMQRYLLMMNQVFRGGAEDTGEAAAPEKPQPRLQSGLQKQSAGGRSSSVAGLRGFARVDSSSSLFSSGVTLLGHAKVQPSVDDFLKLIDKTPTPAMLAEDDENNTELMRLKWLELSGWFNAPGCDVEDPESWLQRGNVEDWVAHYFFRGASAKEFKGEEKRELASLVDVFLDKMGLDLLDGRNNRVRPRLLLSDPLPSSHRPLLVYMGTSFICPLLTLQVMPLLGFSRERVGGLCYWHRPPRRVAPELDLAGPRQAPLVFIHGLGAALVPYYLFIQRLSRRYSGDLYVPELPFLAMAPWESVPSAREVVAQLQDMLLVHRHPAAHFMGHSFGTVVIGWVMKMSRSSVLCVTLMEPAVCLMMKSDVIGKCLWGTPKTCYERFLQFFVFRELFTLNMLCRNQFWEQNTVWPEDFYCPAVFQLASDDGVIHSLFVRRLLENEKAMRKQRRKGKRLTPQMVRPPGSSVDMRKDAVQLSAAQIRIQAGSIEHLEVQWSEGFFHGMILGHPSETQKLFKRMRQMVQPSRSS